MSASWRVVSVDRGSLARIFPRKLAPPGRFSPLEFESSLESVEALMMESRCLMTCSPESPFIMLWVALNETRFTGVL